MKRVDTVKIVIGIVVVYAALWLLSGGITAVSCGATGGAWVHHGNPFFENNWSGSTSFCVHRPYYDVINKHFYYPGGG